MSLLFFHYIVNFEGAKEPGLNRLWICTNKISSIPYKQYTSPNTHFSYTVIYEHTDKILLTLNAQHKHKWKVASKICMSPESVVRVYLLNVV